MKIFIKTFGCTLNKADTEVMAGILKKAGYQLVRSINKSDIVIINSCGVKSPTHSKVIHYIKNVSKTKKIIVGGCLPKMIDVKKQAPNITAVFDTNSITKIAQLIKKNKKRIFSEKKEYRINKPVIRIKKNIAIIPIAQGCLGEPCTYCSVKAARGELRSYKKGDIIRQVKEAVEEGCDKIFLTAQDTGCWGKDIGEKLPELLKEVLSVKGDFKVRLGMSNPNYILEYLKELIQIYKHPKMIKFLHIPVQTGSDKVLRSMRRKYKIKDFKKIVKEFRKEIPKINISTDIIIGFPTEAKKDFEKTIKLIKELKPEVINISKFGPRPKTNAIKMKQLPSQEIKRRSIIIHKLWKGKK